MASPAKQDIPNDLWRIATTLTEEAQEAAVRKCTELGFDPKRGHIPLEETLINLSDARDVILDAVKKNTIKELPLKIQYALLDQLTVASDQLVAIVNGKDAVLALEAAVEDLTASIWNYQLHNLSGEVLGYQTKMNQLKAQETLIRQAAHEAKELSQSKNRADAMLEAIQSVAQSAKGGEESVQGSLIKAAEFLQQCTETQQKVSALAAQVQQNEITTTQQLSNVTQSSANVQATEKTVKEAASDIATAQSQLTDLLGKTQQLISTTEATTQSQMATFKAGFEAAQAAAEANTRELAARAEKNTVDLSADIAQRLDAASATVTGARTELETRISQLYSEIKARLDQAESTQQTKLDGQLKESSNLLQTTITNLGDASAATLKELRTTADGIEKYQGEQFRTRVAELDELEGRIRESIERATGFTLFHSFQRRQIDIERAKRFWAWALAVMVLISLGASGVFIWSLKFVTVYNAAFYLKLSISIPLIYAIAFCNVQYARERRLEEEYAFKSNISISLDPYQRLVKELVDMNKPEELAKYTAFVIDSVNKVFTSPTKVIFDDQAADVGTVQKLMKSVGDLVEPLVKALKKS